MLQHLSPFWLAWAGIYNPAPSLPTPQRTDLAADMELIDKLAANMNKEHSARTLLCCFFFGKVLAPPQFAKVRVWGGGGGRRGGARRARAGRGDVNISQTKPDQAKLAEHRQRRQLQAIILWGRGVLE